MARHTGARRGFRPIGPSLGFRCRCRLSRRTGPQSWADSAAATAVILEERQPTNDTFKGLGAIHRQIASPMMAADPAHKFSEHAASYISFRITARISAATARHARASPFAPASPYSLAAWSLSAAH